MKNMAEMTEPLRELTHKHVEFKWEQRQQEAFELLKKRIKNIPTLGFFSSHRLTKLFADAGPTALGAVLIQEDEYGNKYLVACASTSLSEVQRRYSQIEREAMALVWAMTHFIFYLAGRSFDLHTDCKPLESLFNPKGQPTPRFERWILKIQEFDFRVVHTPGDQMIADCLSRMHNVDVGDVDLEEEVIDKVNAIKIVSGVIAPEELTKASKADAELEAVRKALELNDWPKVLKPYQCVAEQLWKNDEMLFKGVKIVIPKELRDSMLEMGHKGHLGATKMKSAMRRSIWWPGMDQAIERFVENCPGCRLNTMQNAPTPLRRTELPNEAWQYLAIDFMGPLPSGEQLLVIIDYFSRYVEVEFLKCTDTNHVLAALLKQFQRHGFPTRIKADNGPPFQSSEFKSKLKAEGIELTHSAPYSPWQNGEVERINRDIKRNIIINLAMKRDWKKGLGEFLFAYRTTPHSTTGETPLELMKRRTIRGQLPTITEQSDEVESWIEKDKGEKMRGKVAADNRNRAKESTLKAGDKVKIKRSFKKSKWETTYLPEPGTIVEINGVNAIVQMLGGDRCVRSLNHLRKWTGSDAYVTDSDEELIELPTAAVTETTPNLNTESVNDSQQAQITGLGSIFQPSASSTPFTKIGNCEKVQPTFGYNLRSKK